MSKTIVFAATARDLKAKAVFASKAFDQRDEAFDYLKGIASEKGAGAVGLETSRETGANAISTFVGQIEYRVERITY